MTDQNKANTSTLHEMFHPFERKKQLLYFYITLSHVKGQFHIIFVSKSVKKTLFDIVEKYTIKVFCHTVEE